ncbi:UNKNOWN [Stylonychia lemnae]|uniref:Uncharacterized protein n=1 Tax=Stylonychia lemnae TaxID=5949 RepID=A0A078A8X0_STYLE|nr:UNKNOWN [Stylonychia lemnae]|eukprot:CDW78664.1 UNKNOWN [Stylonychia lemnae]
MLQNLNQPKVRNLAHETLYFRSPIELAQILQQNEEERRKKEQVFSDFHQLLQHRLKEEEGISPETCETYFKTLKKQNLVPIDIEEEQQQASQANINSTQIQDNSQSNTDDYKIMNKSPKPIALQCMTVPPIDYDKYNQDGIKAWDLGCSVVEDFILPELKNDDQKSIQVKAVKYDEIMQNLYPQDVQANIKSSTLNQQKIQYMYKNPYHQEIGNTDKKSQLHDFSKVINRDKAACLNIKMLGGHSRNKNQLQSLSHQYDNSVPGVGRYNVSYDQVAYQIQPLVMNKKTFNRRIKQGDFNHILDRSRLAQSSDDLDSQVIEKNSRFEKKERLKSQSIGYRRSNNNKNINILRNLQELSKKFNQTNKQTKLQPQQVEQSPYKNINFTSFIQMKSRKQLIQTNVVGVSSSEIKSYKQISQDKPKQRQNLGVKFTINSAII